MFEINKRRIGGQRAKAFGALFEDFFKQSCRRSQIAVTRIPDSCERVSQTKLIQVKSPFDWIVSFMGMTRVLDTKTVFADRFYYSAIDKYQVRELLAHENAGVLAGYLIWFRPSDRICFYKASLLEECSIKTGSFGEKDAYIPCGSWQVFDPKLLFAAGIEIAK